jgi:coiled-coil domain-containing protein 55
VIILLFQRESERSVQKKQTQQQMKRALEEDPTVYQYDEMYENMEQQKADVVAKKKDVTKKVCNNNLFYKVYYISCLFRKP